MKTLHVHKRTLNNQSPKITKFHMLLYYHKNAFDVTKVAKVSDLAKVFMSDVALATMGQ